ncbi:uncharacterized protein N7479_005975 [Penicillium vulpinum]|uniref:Serine hydrolase domain-containing protein n=1 Tax=Penicillium vulpinum TaxID=29845 RepID=A0A1V6SG53_9EURO|nr:uncharacterized protein N7479_005975 [Penicillium vulpinum]KAJ5958825.1 hypothetical protein N7479_005975 [Penicillium vulpinum]OQE12543.1 hypothetical protein PENVUL_c001G09249 [Penicillium vulpinum]
MCIAICNQEVLTDIPGCGFAWYENENLRSRESNLRQNVRCYSLRPYAASPPNLCLHGGGNNARIFCAQDRGLGAQLRSDLRLVFAQPPFPSDAGFDVLAVYSRWGPFRRWWLRGRPEHLFLSPFEIIRAIDDTPEDAIPRDDEEGETGEWVALLGFS